MRTRATTLVTLAIASALCRADDGDDTLRLYLSKSDLVALGAIASEPGCKFDEAGVPNYLCDFKVAEVCKGDRKLEGTTIRVAVVRFEASDQDRHPLIKKDAKCILFLKGRPVGDVLHWETADFWFGVQHPSPLMARSLKRLAGEGPDLSTYDGVADAIIKVRADLADVLEGITDKRTAEAAKPALREVAKRERAVLDALKRLGDPEGDDDRRLKAKVDAAMKKIDSRMDETMDRLRADAGTWAVIGPMMEEYLEAANPEAAEVRGLAARMEDMNRMRQLAGHAILAETFPLKDGAFDPYAFAATGDIARENYDMFRSARMGKGPTDEEVERGDYTNFPWERYRGDGSEKKRFERVPLLWEKEPGADGQHVVALNDGSCLAMSPADLKAALKR
jgi:hypothetical protein